MFQHSLSLNVTKMWKFISTNLHFSLIQDCFCGSPSFPLKTPLHTTETGYVSRAGCTFCLCLIGPFVCLNMHDGILTCITVSALNPLNTIAQYHKKNEAVPGTTSLYRSINTQI